MNFSTFLITYAPLGISVFSLLVAVLSRCDSKKANSLAEVANETARETLQIADKANTLSEQSNQLAEESNTISQRALAATTDNLAYTWTPQINDDLGILTLTNDSPADALQVAVVISRDGKPIANTLEHEVPGFSEVNLNIQGLLNQHFDKVRQNPSRPASANNGFFFAGAKGEITTTPFTIHVSWVTPTGIPRSDVIEQTLRHRDDYGTIVQC